MLKTGEAIADLVIYIMSSYPNPFAAARWIFSKTDLSMARRLLITDITMDPRIAHRSTTGIDHNSNFQEMVSRRSMVQTTTDLLLRLVINIPRLAKIDLIELPVNGALALDTRVLEAPMSSAVHLETDRCLLHGQRFPSIPTG